MKHLAGVSRWAIGAIALSGVFLVAAQILQRQPLNLWAWGSASTSAQTATTLTDPELGPRHQLTYSQWVHLLGREATVAAEAKPERLTVLAGDSLSLWFPPDLLPADRHWLNQGISGETSTGLRQRLSLLDGTRPDVIFVMIGINDLIRGADGGTVLENSHAIARYLKQIHPRSRIVLQSILPHNSQMAQRHPWDGAPPLWVDRLPQISNTTIRQLNQQLATVADREGIEYLDLHRFFADAQGQLRAELSTDGLHLSRAGYQLWRSHLDSFSQTLASPLPSKPSP